MENIELLDDNLLRDDGNLVIESLTPTNFVILGIVTFGIYPFWWMYKMWVFFKDREMTNIMPAARAIFAIFYMYRLFEKIQAFASKKGFNSNYSSEGLFAIWIVLNLVSRLPDPYWLLSLLSAFVFIRPLEAFNNAIENSESHILEIKSGFNKKQWGLLIVFGLFLILVIFAMFVPDEYLVDY